MSGLGIAPDVLAMQNVDTGSPVAGVAPFGVVMTVSTNGESESRRPVVLSA